MNIQDSSSNNYLNISFEAKTQQRAPYKSVIGLSLLKKNGICKELKIKIKNISNQVLKIQLSLKNGDSSPFSLKQKKLNVHSKTFTLLPQEEIDIILGVGKRNLNNLEDQFKITMINSEENSVQELSYELIQLIHKFASRPQQGPIALYNSEQIRDPYFPKTQATEASTPQTPPIHLAPGASATQHTPLNNQNSISIPTGYYPQDQVTEPSIVVSETPLQHTSLNNHSFTMFSPTFYHYPLYVYQIPIVNGTLNVRTSLLFPERRD